MYWSILISFIFFLKIKIKMCIVSIHSSCIDVVLLTIQSSFFFILITNHSSCFLSCFGSFSCIDMDHSSILFISGSLKLRRMVGGHDNSLSRSTEPHCSDNDSSIYVRIHHVLVLWKWRGWPKRNRACHSNESWILIEENE